jgi:hypothetical protein
MERDGIVWQSTRSWLALLNMVQKKNSSKGHAVSFHCLNLVTEKNTYPLPTMLDIASIEAGYNVLNKVDLHEGYHLIPMNQNTRWSWRPPLPLQVSAPTLWPKEPRHHLPAPHRQSIVGPPWCFWYQDDIIVAYAI